MKTPSLLSAILLILLALMANAADADSLKMIDELFRDYNRPDLPGASVMVILNGKVLLAKSYGLANVEDKIPASPDSNYRLASVSKQFTAMSVMILADAGKLSFDDPITKFFPEFPAYGTNITVRLLLNHTSGLLDYENLIPEGTTIPVLDINALRLVAQQDKTNFPPGTQFRYSNTGFALLALIVEKVSGMTYPAFLQKHIFQPLGMKHSLAYEVGISTVTNRVFGYTKKGNAFTRTDQSVTSSVLGDGGIYSSLNDLYHWDQALYTTRLVSKKMLAQAFTSGTSTLHDNNLQYGFGWFISDYRGLRNIWHSGNSIGFTTRIERFPDQHFTVIILTNRNNARIAEIPHKIADLYLFDSK
jgi:CubicO group peptidase (beta-lactamase class C family)